MHSEVSFWKLNQHHPMQQVTVKTDDDENTIHEIVTERPSATRQDVQPQRRSENIAKNSCLLRVLPSTQLISLLDCSAAPIGSRSRLRLSW